MIYTMCAEKNPPLAFGFGESLKGKLLIAMPDMGDPRFDKAVILMLEHGIDGAMGVVINKPLDAIQFNELLDQLEIDQDKAVNTADYTVHFGGPVELGRGFVLHSKDVLLGHSVLLEPIAVTTSLEMLALIADKKGPEQSLFCLGYTGWSAGQLEEELKQNAWLHAPLDPSILFDQPYENRWEAAMALVGVSPDHLSSVAGRA